MSNLTNLLAFQASGLSFTRFGGLMALPWLVAVAVEWFVLRRAFAPELRGDAPRSARPVDRPELPWFALAVVALALVGFGLSSPIGVAPAWIAAGAAVVLALRERVPLGGAARAAQPTFLIFVLALGIIVHAASEHGLSSVVASLIPHGTTLPVLLAVAGISAVLANLVNNLPATLIILPVAASTGTGQVLAMLVGVNVGPNLTYVGSLATLLWRRIAHAHDHETDLGEFTRLGLRTVPLALAASTAALWLALQVRLMRAVVWISEATWEACVDQAAAFLPEDADVTLLHVAPSDVEEFARSVALRACSGATRRHRRRRKPPLRAIAEEEAQGAARRCTDPARAPGPDRLAARARSNGRWWRRARAPTCSS